MRTKERELDGWYKCVGTAGGHLNVECIRIGSYIHELDLWDNARREHILEPLSEDEAVILSLQGLSRRERAEAGWHAV